ncbi:hypothetical protein Pla123a_42680 [Posidoniimonas polymericola]|uniref:DUF5615 domain-containing protein n=1 Tax=Posidoniimonas polymericola TaxID=2528002 RepID=A0A5C5Y2C9_9BACT|nr:DUF5615 family PIN-like protein [Posidoniimonas polymericola]TWT67712.1 hypothetical protein Pla123a_42680 [Posidoniimonas polymericola]
MRLLLDENLPHEFRNDIVGHQCETVAYNGWSGKRNGDLLRTAAAAGFDALVTNDSNIPHQQNIAALPLSIVNLLAPTNNLEDLRPLVPALLESLQALEANQVTYVR